VVKNKRNYRPEFITVAVFISAIILIIIIAWRQKHAAIGWSIIGVIIAALVYALYRFQGFRNRVLKITKNIFEKIAFTRSFSGREPIPTALYKQVMSRANGRCQNPDCPYHSKPEVHHINHNNADNVLINLIALCPNCHRDAHEGRYTFSQLRSWLRIHSENQQTQL